MKKLLLLVDLANLNGQTARSGRRPNLPALVRLVESATGLSVAASVVYAPLPIAHSEPLERYHDWLRAQGFTVVSKRGKRLPDGRTKCDMDVDLAVDGLELARSARPDRVVLVSGDGDMVPLVRALRRLAIRVEIATTMASLARELILEAHAVIRIESWLSECDDFTSHDRNGSRQELPKPMEEACCA